MIYGVVGTLDRDTMMKFGLYNIKTGRFTRVASKKGNGKTMVLTYYGYREHTEQNRKVFSNYHTKFSTYRPAQQIFNDLGRLLDLAGKYGAYGTINEIMKNFDHIFSHYPLTQTEQTEFYEIRSLYTEYYGSLILLTEFQKFFNSLGTSTKTIKWIEGILTQLRKLGIDAIWDAQRPISAGNRSREYTETFLVPQKFHEEDLSPCDKDICDRDHLIYVYSDIPFREKELCVLNCKEVGKLYETDEVIGDELVSPREQGNGEKKPKKPKAKKEPVPIPVITNREEFIEGVKDGIVEALDEYGEEPDYVPVDALVKEEPPKEVEPLEPLFEPKIDVIIDKEDVGPAMDLLEMEMIKAHPNIPAIIKTHLNEYKENGKIHELFLVYFDEDGNARGLSRALEPGPFRASPEGLLAFNIRQVIKNGH
jgi:hypothetical protein